MVFAIGLDKYGLGLVASLLSFEVKELLSSSKSYGTQLKHWCNPQIKARN